MKRTPLLHALKLYAQGSLITKPEHPFIEQLFTFIESTPDCFERQNPGHITGSAWICNYEGTQVLLTHHKKLNIWVQLGGHADGNSDTKAVALTEAREESGIEDLTLLHPDIFDIDIHSIPNACMVHYDIRYIFRAPRNAQFVVSDESHTLAWVPLKDISSYSSEPSVLRMAEKMSRFV